MIKKGDRVIIREEWRNEGESDEVYIAVEDQYSNHNGKHSVAIVPECSTMHILPAETVRTDMLKPEKPQRVYNPCGGTFELDGDTARVVDPTKAANGKTLSVGDRFRSVWDAPGEDYRQVTGLRILDNDIEIRTKNGCAYFSEVFDIIHRGQ